MSSPEAERVDRINRSFLAKAEKRLLVAMAHRIPARVTPDHLTVLGVMGAALVAVGCWAAHLHSAGYFVAILGLVVNWFGDSLDGTVARVRRMERPQYGFFVDHVSDILSHTLYFFGLGLSPLMYLGSALMAFLASLYVMCYRLLRLRHTNTLRIDDYGLGPTEFRILIAFGLAVAGTFGMPSFEFGGFWRATPFDLVSIAVFFATIVMIAMQFHKDRIELARLEPSPHGPAGSPGEERPS